MLNASYVMLGSPCSGKGTIGKIISDKLNIPVIAPGVIYGAIRKQQTEMGELVRESLKDGGICPDYLTNDIVATEALKFKKNGYNRLIMDGYPRSLNQLDYLQINFTVGTYLHLDAPYEKLLEASVNRRRCPVCGFTLSLLKPERSCGCVPQDKWIMRFDDGAEFFEKRHKTYLEVTKPIISRVKNFNNYLKINIFDYNIEDIDTRTFINSLTIQPY